MAGATLIAITNINTEGKLRVFTLVRALATPNNNGPEQYKWTFSTARVAEQKLVEIISKAPSAFINATVSDGKVKGKEASLDRIKTDDGKPRPVILSIIKDNTERVLGYKVAYGTQVRNLKLKDIKALCEKMSANGDIAFQNAMYVRDTDDKQAYIRAYPNTPFFVETYNRGVNTYAESRKVDIKANEGYISNAFSEKKEQAAQPEKNIYTAEQKEQLRLGKEHGVKISIFGNPKLSAAQMKEIRIGLEEGLPSNLYAFPEYKVECMQVYRDELECSRDIREYLSPDYNLEQISALSLAQDLGIRIDTINNPKLSAEEMHERILRLEMELWYSKDAVKEEM